MRQSTKIYSLCVRRQYISQNPLDIVGVHCTHGFNRTGFLISAFMIEEHDWSVDAAVQEFRSARAPGIYKGDYLRDIYVRFGLIKMLLIFVINVSILI